MSSSARSPQPAGTAPRLHLRPADTELQARAATHRSPCGALLSKCNSLRSLFVFFPLSFRPEPPPRPSPRRGPGGRREGPGAAPGPAKANSSAGTAAPWQPPRGSKEATGSGHRDPSLETHAGSSSKAQRNKGTRERAGRGPAGPGAAPSRPLTGRAGARASRTGPGLPCPGHRGAAEEPEQDQPRSARQELPRVPSRPAVAPPLPLRDESRQARRITPDELHSAPPLPPPAAPQEPSPSSPVGSAHLQPRRSPAQGTALTLRRAAPALSRHAAGGAAAPARRQRERAAEGGHGEPEAAAGTQSRGCGRLSRQAEGGDASLYVYSPRPISRPSPPAPPCSPPSPLRLLSRLQSAPGLCVLSFSSLLVPSARLIPERGRSGPQQPPLQPRPAPVLPRLPRPPPPARGGWGKPSWG